jgi:RNA polymerase sigma-70 factor, ECF subfamily
MREPYGLRVSVATLPLKPRQRGGNRPIPHDDELVRLILSGERSAFTALMRRYDQLLYRTARSILRNDADAEDALQESYLLAYRALGKFRGQAKLSTWLMRIVVNEAVGRLRKRRRAGVFESDSALQTWRDAHLSAPERPDEAFSRADIRRLIEATIDALPAAYRIVFVLRVVQDVSIPEISAVLRIPTATVRSRLSRARRLLRSALKRLDVTAEDIFRFAGARCDRLVHSVNATLKRPAAMVIARHRAATIPH